MELLDRFGALPLLSPACVGVDFRCPTDGCRRNFLMRNAVAYEKKRADKLLYQLFPAHVAEKLKVCVILIFTKNLNHIDRVVCVMIMRRTSIQAIRWAE